MLKKTVLLFFIFIFLLALLLLSLELALRMKGYEPFSEDINLPKIVPGGKLYTKDSVLGWRPIAGKYTVYYPDGKNKFSATYLSNSTRITKPLDEYKNTDKKPQIWIFGDSFVNGYSLNDNQTFAWILQEKFPQIEMVNYGVGGYGTIQSLLQFKQELKDKKPVLVIFGYSSYLDQRNVFSRSWRKAEFSANKLGQAYQPYALLSKRGEINYFFEEITYRKLPFQEYSALLNRIDSKLNDLIDKLGNGHRVTEILIVQFFQEAKKNKIPVIFATFHNDLLTKDTLIYAKNLRMETVDISLDYSKSKYTNMPYDAHPSALANTIFEQKLEKKIMQILR